MLIISFLVVFACNENPTNHLSLPFYNTAEFTPEWIKDTSSDYPNIHTISQYEFTNQEGRAFGSKNLKGSIYVADFIFTICPSICPKMTTNLSRVQEVFSYKEVQLVSFSVMPWLDSVAVLNNYALKRGVNSEQWNLLTGPQEEIYKLARQSFFAEKEIGLTKDKSAFLHTENFILVDAKGRIRGVYNGTLRLEVNRLIKDIRTLLKYS